MSIFKPITKEWEGQKVKLHRNYGIDGMKVSKIYTIKNVKIYLTEQHIDFVEFGGGPWYFQDNDKNKILELISYQEQSIILSRSILAHLDNTENAISKNK